MSGLRVDGHASQTISDTLRWEVLRGRAIRLGWGRYALGRLARSTKHRMRQRLVACHARITQRREPIDERPEVGLASEFFASIRSVALTRHGPDTPRPGSTVQMANAPP